MSTLVIGLGNPVLTDDGVGLVVMRKLERRVSRGDLEFIEMGAGGIRLLDVVPGHKTVVLIDAVVTGDAPPGAMHEVLLLDDGERYVPADTSEGGERLARLVACSPRLASAHDADLATTLDLARRLGAPMPKEILIFAIEAANVTDFSEDLTPEVSAGVTAIVDRICAALAV
jgi:hydrogenase maturation protease